MLAIHPNVMLSWSRPRSKRCAGNGRARDHRHAVEPGREHRRRELHGRLTTSSGFGRRRAQRSPREQSMRLTSSAQLGRSSLRRLIRVLILVTVVIFVLGTAVGVDADADRIGSDHHRDHCREFPLRSRSKVTRLRRDQACHASWPASAALLAPQPNQSAAQARAAGRQSAAQDNPPAPLHACSLGRAASRKLSPSSIHRAGSRYRRAHVPRPAERAPEFCRRLG